MSCVSIGQDTEVSDGVGSGFLLLTCHNKLVWMWIAVSGCRLNLRQQRRQRPRHHRVVRSSSWYPLLVQLIVRKSACGDSYCVVQVCIHITISEKKRFVFKSHCSQEYLSALAVCRVFGITSTKWCLERTGDCWCLLGFFFVLCWGFTSTSLPLQGLGFLLHGTDILVGSL